MSPDADLTACPVRRLRWVLHQGKEHQMGLADRGQTLLGGIVGSRAYGLNQPDSDTDRMRVVALPTTDMLGLSNPKLTEHTAIPGGDDTTTYEIRDFIGQALKSAPGALDMLWLPSHTTMSPHGEELVANRSRFLSQSIRNPAQGILRKHARSHAADPSKSTPKNHRHAYRMVRQAMTAWETGAFPVRLDQTTIAEVRAFESAPDYEKIEAASAAVFAGPTRLPAEPDRDWAEQFLLRVRAANYKPVC